MTVTTRFSFLSTVQMCVPLILVLVICALQLHAQPKATGTFVTIDIPGATFLELEGINPRGDIVGAYYDSSSTLQNFLLSNGSVHNINPPGGSGFDYLLNTTIGINPQGDIVATYADSSGTGHGFLLSSDTYTYINAPGAAGNEGCAPPGTWPAGINAQGDIVGWYVDSTCVQYHGFLLSKGIYTAIDVPAALGALPGTTVALAINPQGDILGIYSSASGFPIPLPHGFLLSHGTFSTIDVPGAIFTQTYGMNPRGDIVGRASTGGVLLSQGTVTTIDAPGSCGPTCTVPMGINPEGDIAGYYLDSSSNQHGFLLKRN